MYCVYILFSEKINRFYFGSTDNVDNRLLEHNTSKFLGAFTNNGIPWKIVLVIENLHSKQAFGIEEHLKNMKSTKYIHNLIQYPEMQEKLTERFK